MKSKTAKQIIKVLLKNGFILSRQKGSHNIYKHTEMGVIVPVPLHGKTKIIPIGTFLAIVKQSGISKDKFK